MGRVICWFFTWVVIAVHAAEEIGGLWKTINEEGEAQSVIAFYQYDSLYYGRLIATFDEEGRIQDSIDHPIKRAPGIEGHPYYCGLDILWNLRDAGSIFKGKVIDPESGKIYNAEVWLEEPDLVVRGKLLFFGRSQRWLPMTDADLPQGFQRPDVTKFVPSIPSGA